jgi:hypothetical protein
MSSLVIPLLAWYSGSRQSLMDSVEQKDYLSHLLILTEPSGILGIISIPLLSTD